MRIRIPECLMLDRDDSDRFYKTRSIVAEGGFATVPESNITQENGRCILDYDVNYIVSVWAPSVRNVPDRAKYRAGIGTMLQATFDKYFSCPVTVYAGYEKQAEKEREDFEKNRNDMLDVDIPLELIQKLDPKRIPYGEHLLPYNEDCYEAKILNGPLRMSETYMIFAPEEIEIGERTARVRMPAAERNCYVQNGHEFILAVSPRQVKRDYDDYIMGRGK